MALWFPLEPSLQIKPQVLLEFMPTRTSTRRESLLHVMTDVTTDLTQRALPVHDFVFHDFRIPAASHPDSFDS
jgi:hypothetical protein